MPELDIAQALNDTCPWSGKPIQPDSLTLYRGSVVGFCNPGCRDKFETATRHFETALAGRGAPDGAAPDAVDPSRTASP